MPRGNRSLRVTLGLVVAAVFGVTVGGYLYVDASRLESQYQRQTNDKANHYRERAHVRVERRCHLVPPESRRQCVYEEYNAAEQAEHDQNDLQAQLVTSAWTRAMGIAAIIGMMVGIGGIGLVFTTFRETKRSADAAHEANRPWVEAIPEDLAFAWGKDGGELTLMAKMVNHGNSPATNVVIRVWLAVVPRAQYDCPTPIADLLTMALEIVEIRKDRGGKALFPGGPDLQKRVAMVSPEDIAAARGTEKGPMRFLFAIGVTYCFGGRNGRTVKTYTLTMREGIDWDRPASNVVKGDKLRLTDRFKGYAT